MTDLQDLDGVSFRAFVVRSEGDNLNSGVEEFTVADLPDGDVVVKVSWSSLNFKDGMVTVPGNRVARISPLVPGIDLAGVVVASAAPGVAVGDEVLAHGYDLGVARHGGFAMYARLPASWIVPLQGLSARDAMALGTAGFTAAMSVDELERRGMQPGDGPVLVTGATGGVGSVSVAILAARGYEVVASTGKDAEGWLRTLGAAQVIGRDDIDDNAGRVLGTERWAGAVDCVGGTTLSRVLRCLKYGAAVAASGLTGGTALETTVFPFITRHVALLGIDSVLTPLARRRDVWKRLATDMRPSDLELIVAREVTLDGLPAALDEIRGSALQGRVLVRLED